MSPLPKLYYFHDATCGIKARLAMFEKSVEFEPMVLDRFNLTEPDYLSINPKGVVPTLIHAGRTIYESSVISLYIDDAFAGPPLRPHSAIDRARMYSWLKAIDERFFKAIGSTTFGLALRQQILHTYETPESLEAYFRNIRVDEYRTRRRSIIAEGIKAPAVQDGIRTLAAMVIELDDALAESAFAAGPDYSLADASLTPFVLRIEALGLDRLWASCPHLKNWWQVMQARDSFQRLISESFSPQYFEDMRASVGDVWDDVEAIVSAGST